MFKRLLSSYSTQHCKRLSKDDLSSLAKRSGGTVSVRQYLEFLNKPSIVMQNDVFFNTTQYNQINGNYCLVKDSPDFIYSMAKWLWVDYKLNNYPFFDLNVLQIFTNLDSSLDTVKEIMKFWQLKLLNEQFERIRYILVPLFPLGEIPNRLKRKLDTIPGNVTIVNNIDNNPFDDVNQLNKKSLETEIRKVHSDKPVTWIQDPVYMLFLNDIMCYTASDIVRFKLTEQKWQQRFLTFNNSGNLTRDVNYVDDLDPLCAETVTILQDYILDNNEDFRHGQDEIELIIPSQLLKLLNVARRLVPDYKIFAIDESIKERTTRWWDSFFDVSSGQKSMNETLVSSLLDQIYNQGPIPIRQPINFNFVRQLITKDAFKPIAVDTVINFTKTWSDPDEFTTMRQLRNDNYSLKLLRSH